MEFVHKSVLFDEAIKALDLNENKIIVDGTAGGGGHSGEIAKRAKWVISIDQDPDAIAVLNERLGDKENVTIVHDNYSNIKNIISNLNIEKIDGLLLDLGVSSFQLDTAERGFSFHKDAPLDMRMNTMQSLDAKKIVNDYEEEQLANLLYYYGELRESRKLAREIVHARKTNSIETTDDLKKVFSYIPAHKQNKFFAQIFQAIRIEVNQELEVLKEMLQQAYNILNPKGRLVVISYHSLEDRLVKRFLKSLFYNKNY